MQARFTHLNGGKQGQHEVFNALPVRIGRSSSNDLIFRSEDTRASSRHAEINSDGASLIIKDLGSTNGTFVNGLRITQVRLNNGDVVEFGLGGPKVSVEFDLAGPAATNKRDRRPIMAKTVDTEASDLPTINPAPNYSPNPRLKEFGRETVQMMLNEAVNRSTTSWKVLLGLSLLAFAAVVSILLYQQFYASGSRTTVNAPVPQTISFADIATHNQHAMVLIYNRFELYDKSGKLLQEQVSNGSGFVVSKDGEIITNRHVIEPWVFKNSTAQSGTIGASTAVGKIKQLGIFFADDPLDAEHMYVVKEYHFSQEADVAVLRISPPRGLQSVQGINDNIDGLQQGEEIAVLAFPLGLELNELTQDRTAKSSLMRGVISKIPENKKQIQLDIAAYEGSSGGPIFNSKGEVIGLLTSGPNDTLNFATPIRFATKLLKQKS
ncbi:MAG: trypsin-like peptidase domain-containing protein [Acidobacteriota bacterium]